MKIYILPISGGGFVAQLGILYELYKSTRENQLGRPHSLGITPDLVMASSGGNVASYIAMVNNWSDTGILTNVELIDSSIFIKSWTPSFLPTWLVYPLTGSLYKAVDGMEELFNSLYTKASIGTTEIWTGTYNSTKQKAIMFCNKSFADAKVKDTRSSYYLYDQGESIYLDYDIEGIGKACYASAAIPLVTPGIIINGDKYLDGGTAYSSPLIPMESKVNEAIARSTDMTSSGKPLVQLHYFCSYDMDMKFSDSMYSAIIGLLIHSSLLQDRAAALSMLRKYGNVPDTPIVYSNVKTAQLGNIIKQYETKSYLMIFFPRGAPSVSSTNFTGKEVRDIILKMNGNYSIYLYECK